jgi:glycerol uptake facilitator-like aquaporin
VIGSGIMGERLAGGNVAIALLANSTATGAGLVALILTFGPISGAHFNPAVTLATAARGRLGWNEVPAYLGSQVAGAFGGALVAHVMFGEPAFASSDQVRSGVGQLAGELVATFGLLAVIQGCAWSRPSAAALAVGPTLRLLIGLPLPPRSPTRPSLWLARRVTPSPGSVLQMFLDSSSPNSSVLARRRLPSGGSRPTLHLPERRNDAS